MTNGSIEKLALQTTWIEGCGEDHAIRSTLMKFKLFTDMIEALGKVVGGLKAIVKLPQAEWETMRKTLETYCLADITSVRQSRSCRTKLWKTNLQYLIKIKGS